MTCDIKQKIYTKQTIVFGLPVISSNYYTLKKYVHQLPYELYAIQYRLLTINKPFLNEQIKIEREITKQFLVKATITDDIYELYYKNGLKLEKFANAYISNFKTSVMMNSLFRNIKENINLDALEESDDEGEFENIEPDKFVDLEKHYVMNCVYLKKFKAWKPLSVSSKNITPRREIVIYK